MPTSRSKWDIETRDNDACLSTLRPITVRTTVSRVLLTISVRNAKSIPYKTALTHQLPDADTTTHNSTFSKIYLRYDLHVTTIYDYLIVWLKFVPTLLCLC